MRLFLILLYIALFTCQTFAIGGLPVDEIACTPDEHPGVGMVQVVFKKRKHIIGTVQLLPYTNGTLCISSKHLIKKLMKREHTGNVVFTTSSGDFKTIAIDKIYAYPQKRVDIAIYKLKESVHIPDTDLPKLPDQDFDQRRLTNIGPYLSTPAIMVGYGKTTKKGSPLDTTSRNFMVKCKGNVNLKPDAYGWVSFERTRPWHTCLPNDQITDSPTYAAPGDYGGPLLIAGTLAGLISRCEKDIRDCFDSKIKSYITYFQPLYGYLTFIKDIYAIEGFSIDMFQGKPNWLDVDFINAIRDKTNNPCSRPLLLFGVVYDPPEKFAEHHKYERARDEFAREFVNSLRALTALCAPNGGSFTIYDFLSAKCNETISRAFKNYVKRKIYKQPLTGEDVISL